MHVVPNEIITVYEDLQEAFSEAIDRGDTEKANQINTSMSRIAMLQMDHIVMDRKRSEKLLVDNAFSDEFIEGQKDCREGLKPRKDTEAYLRGFGAQYEKEQIDTHNTLGE
jgi:hypothetical protein